MVGVERVKAAEGRDRDSGQTQRQQHDQGKGGRGVKNVEMTVEGNILTMTVDLTKDFGRSSSGKTIIIASTEGNVSIPNREEVKVGLNVYKKK